jgi:Fur family ferric uptake transcriptional regulator
VGRAIFRRQTIDTLSLQLPPAQFEEVRDRFAAFIRQRRQRQTPERFAILEEIYASQEHVDADTLFGRLRARGVAVSRATVYNTLELLLECDLVVRHQFGGSQAKYERAWAYWQHDHLLCVDCGAIFEFCDPRLQEIQESVAGIYGFEVARHALNVYGRCRRENCENREEGPARRTHRPPPSSN